MQEKSSEMVRLRLEALGKGPNRAERRKGSKMYLFLSLWHCVVLVGNLVRSKMWRNSRCQMYDVGPRTQKTYACGR